MTKKTKLSHRAIALFLGCTFLPSLVPINYVFASNNGPTAPEAASFEPVDTTDMVNLVTGDFTYVMPVMNVPSPQGGYPLSLSYHAGVAMDQEASWVGLGWNLNPGAINRNLFGIPDDHDNFKIQDINYNLIDEYSDFEVGLNYGTISNGVGLSYSTHKGFGGSAQFGLLEYEYNQTDGSTIGISANIAKSSAGKFSGSLSADLNYNFKSKVTSVGLNAGIGRGNFRLGSGIGINLSSAGANVSTGISVNGASYFNGGAITGQVNSTFKGWSLPIPIYKTGFILNIRSGKFKHWIYNNETNFGVGSLAFNDSHETYDHNFTNDKQGVFFTTDVTLQSTNPYELGPGEGIPSSVNSDALEELNLPSYDNFIVNSQGISGNFSPRYFEDIILPLGRRQLVQKSLDNQQNDETLYIRRNYLWENVGTKGTPKFYFNNEFSSYLEVSKFNPNNSSNSLEEGYWNLNQLNSNETLTNVSQNTSFNSQYDGNNGYNSNLNRKRTGSYIKSYTKNEVSVTNSDFIKATNNGEIHDYTTILGKTDSDYSVIGFRVTAADGKTYHYSLPVYQKEQIAKVVKEYEANNKFNERRNFSNYATHWLLTAITGSDFYDLNGNDFPDEDDYGYWVNFEYGKWSDGFGWKTKTTKSMALEDCDDPIGNPQACEEVNYFSSTTGVKEIYYLNKIKTKTHSALFLKSERDDANGKAFVHGNSTNPIIYDNIKKELYSSTGNVTISTNQFKSYYAVKKQKNLKLDKIVLVKNENDNYRSDDNFVTGTSEGGNFFFQESGDSFVLDRHLGSFTDTIHQNSWNAEFYNNVLERNDISNYENLLTKAVKVVDFGYDYSLKNSLSLKAVNLLGKGGCSLIPPYRYEYYNRAFDTDETDLRWGFNKQQISAWSLKSIKNPTGGKIEVVYESDRFKSLLDIKNEINSNNWQEHYEGGLRVREVKIVNDQNDTRKMTYQYEGGISYSRPEDVPNLTLDFQKYDDEVFALGPQILYRKVTETHVDSNNNSYLEVDYEFDVPEPKVVQNGDIYKVDLDTDRYFKKIYKKSDLGTSVNRSGNIYNLKKSSFTLVDNKVALGRLLKIKRFNSANQLLQMTKSNYRDYDVAGFDKHGLEQESFSSYKRYDSWDFNEDNFFGGDGTTRSREYWLHASSKISYPNVLESVETTTGNFTFTSKTNKWDFLTGRTLETETMQSNGKAFLSSVVPAYHISEYADMGSLSDGNNKNMLTQDAVSASFIKNEGNTWGRISSEISTWKPNQNNVWHKHKSFIWDGAIDDQGVFANYSGSYDNFNWTLETNDQDVVQPTRWKQISEISKYNNFSTPLEIIDINGNEAATKMGDDDEKVYASGTAAYNEIFYSGAEDIALNGVDFGGDVQKGNASITTDAHTGTQALQIGSGQTAFEVSVDNGSNPERQYKISLWAKANNYANTKVIVGGSNINHSATELVRAGNWVQMNFYAPINGQKNIHVTAIGGSTIVDDFRVHPIDASLTSYVYNEWDELTHILGPNNMATRYEYDEMGRLEYTYSEVIDFDQEGSGGFKKTSKNQYTYKY